MKKALKKYFVRSFFKLLCLTYLWSIFNFEIINLSHELSHYFSHNHLHHHSFQDHLISFALKHNHKELLLLFTHNEQNEKDKENKPGVSLKKDLDNHNKPNLIFSSKPDSISSLIFIRSGDKFLSFLFVPITPPPQNISL